LWYFLHGMIGKLVEKFVIINHRLKRRLHVPLHINFSSKNIEDIHLRLLICCCLVIATVSCSVSIVRDVQQEPISGAQLISSLLAPCACRKGH
jgi:hypothetical protein